MLFMLHLLELFIFFFSSRVCRVILIIPSFHFQRIAIARALLKNAPVLILDEVIFDPSLLPLLSMYALQYNSVSGLCIFFLFVNSGLSLNLFIILHYKHISQSALGRPYDYLHHRITAIQLNSEQYKYE